MYLRVTLKSDLCAASGHGHAGAIDADINYDEITGLPYVPSKRIKGCLREAGLDILSICPEYENAFYELFGRKGQSNAGELKIRDGKLAYKVGELNNGEVLDALTTIRTNIRMESGAGLISKTRDEMLRVTRVLNRGEELFFKVECPVHLDFFRKCCKMLRNIGSNRTRGLGEIECSLIDDDECPIREFEWSGSKFTTFPYEFPYALPNVDGEQRVAYYQISLDEPIISAPISGSSGCESYLPGSMMLGSFAGLWLKSPRRLKREQMMHDVPGVCGADGVSGTDGADDADDAGSVDSVGGAGGTLDTSGTNGSNYADESPSVQDAHEDPVFRRLFLEGGVKFGNAYPCSLRKKPYYPAPACIKTDKTEDHAHDVSVSDNDKVMRKINGFVDFSNEYGEPLTPLKINARHEVAQHHARLYDRAAGHAREGGNAADGALFSYMALSAGQTFVGRIVGSEDDLKLLNDVSTKKIRLGRSRSAQYGSAMFDWIDIDRYMRISPKDSIDNEDENASSVNSAPTSDSSPTVTLAPTSDLTPSVTLAPTSDSVLSLALIIPPSGHVRVHARSPLILCDNNGTIRPDIKLLENRLGLGAERTFASATLVGGYNSKWRLPLQQMSAIQAGSVIIMRNDAGHCITLVPEQFIGLRTGEGYGHISIEAIPESGELQSPISKESYHPKNIVTGGKFASDKLHEKEINDRSAKLHDRIDFVKERRAYEGRASRELKKKIKDAPTNAQLSRLLNALHRKRNPIDSLASLKRELRDENPEWKDEGKRRIMQDFTGINNTFTSDWELYKIWLTTLIHLVKLERRKSDA